MSSTPTNPSFFDEDLADARRDNALRRRHLPVALRLVLGLALLVVSGTLVLMLPIMATNEPLAFNDALFTATSALSVTGLSTITVATDLTFPGQLVLLSLIQIGGVGFMVVAVITFRLLGRKISIYDRIALSDSLGLLSPGQILKLTRRALITLLVLEGIGATLLWLHWRNDERLSAEQAVFYAIFHAVSAFCNAGFDLFTGTPGYPQGIPRDSLSLLILAGLIITGGLGIPVISDLLTYPLYRKFSLHSRLTLLTVTGLTIFGWVSIFIAERRPEVGALVNESFDRQLVISFFQSVSARTAGFAGVPNFERLSPAGEMTMMVLMFIGCPPASMGGGITTGTFTTLLLSLWCYARGLPGTQFGGRSLPTGSVRKAAAVLTIGILVCGTVIWLLLMTHDAPLDLVVFEVISAFATCGLSLAFTDDLNLFGQLLICATMFWGRLGALTIVIALARQGNARHLITYPEESVFIG